MKHLPIILCLLSFGLHARPSPPSLKAILLDQVAQVSITDTIICRSNTQITLLLSCTAESFYYQLAGFSNQTQITDLPIIQFSQLPSGIYQLTIADNQDLQRPIIITLRIKSAYMATWGFSILLVLSTLLPGLAAFYFIWRSSQRNLEKIEDLRNDWTNKLHTDIGGDLSSVALRIGIIQTQNKDLNPAIIANATKALKTLETAKNQLRFLFNLVDPKKNSLSVMLDDISDYAKESYQLKGTQFTAKIDTTAVEKSSIDIGRVNKLYLVLKELINNSYKYAEADIASLNITHGKEGIKIILQDDGIGYDIEAPKTGNGLANIQAYAQEGFMSIHTTTAPGQGTKTTIQVPNL